MDKNYCAPKEWFIKVQVVDINNPPDELPDLDYKLLLCDKVRFSGFSSPEVYFTKLIPKLPWREKISADHQIAIAKKISWTFI